MHADRSIFKAYDIRGTVPRTLNTGVAYALGRAFARTARAVGERVIAIGRDGRLTSPALAHALASGLASAGAEVIDLGLATTPMLYFATHTLCASGVAVTGSHNPPADNGFKLVLQGQALHDDAIQALRAAMDADDNRDAPGGSVRTYDILPSYRARIASDIHLARPMRVLVDSGNGVTGASTPDILRAIGCAAQGLFTTVDGRFPNHHPDPSRPANLKTLQAALAQSDAELGLAFDGDGDRLGVVTRTGRMIAADRLLILLARDVLRRRPGASVVFDVKCSQQLAPAIRAAGGVPVMAPTGHSLIKARMRATGAALAGEMSGHLFFAERWYGFDDATYAACRLLEILARAPDASAALEALPSAIATPELQVPCAPGEAHRVAERLQALAPQAFRAPARLTTFDGLRVDWPDGFGLVRASNTTPVLVLRFEGRTPEALARIQMALLALLQRVKPDAAIEP